MTDEEPDPLLNQKKFQSHRRIAGTSLIGIFTIVGFTVFVIDGESVEHYETIFSASIYAFTGIIATYMGTTSWVASNFYKK